MKMMNTVLRGTLATGALLFTGVAFAGIANTPHNLGSNGPGPNNYNATGDLCVFCHTPHGSDTAAPVALWNRKLPADPVAKGYVTYDSLGTSTLDGKTTLVGSVSIACLSCHDGTQAMNVVLNAPGSGGWNPNVDPGVPQAGWTGPASTANPAGSLNYATASIVEIGLDLRNDHPVGIQYGGGGQDTANPGGTFKDQDFVNTANELIGGTRIWWVDTAIGQGGVREKTDMLLYTRIGDPSKGFTTGNPEPFVECGSCHDPHAESLNPNQEVNFLRISNNNSEVCLACHTK
jgi:hypothetical protein